MNKRQEKDQKFELDPVCQMQIERKTSFNSEYKGKKYYFCSSDCKDSFDSEPNNYIVKA